MNDSEQDRPGSEGGGGIIGLRTAILIYALLAVCAAFALKGNARLIVLLIIVLLGLKTYVHHIRRRLE